MTWFRLLGKLFPPGIRRPNRSDSRLGEAQALVGLGKARRGLGEFSDAESDLRDGAKIYEAEHDDCGQREALNELAMTLAAEGREGHAREIWNQLAGKQPSDSGRSGHLPKSIYDLFRGNPQLASIVGGVTLQVETLNAAERTVSDARRSGDRRAEAEGLMRQSEMLRERGMDVPKAMLLADQAATIFHELSDVREASAYYALGRACQDAELTKDALSAYQTAAQVAEHVGATQVQAKALREAAWLLKVTGQPDRGFEDLVRSVELFQQIGDTHGEGRAKSSLGAMLLDRGQHDEAATEFRAAIDLCRSAGEFYGRVAAQLKLPVALLKAGHYSEAVTAGLGALDICTDINHREGETEALANLGFAYLMEGDYPKSQQRYTQLLNYASEQRTQGKGHLDGRLVKQIEDSGIDCCGAAETWLREESYEKSIKSYSQAADLFAASGNGENEAKALFKLGFGLRMLGNWEESNEILNRAYEVGMQHGETRLAALAWVALGGNLIDFGYPEKALPYLNWALKEGRRIKDIAVQEGATHHLEVARRKMAG